MEQATTPTPATTPAPNPENEKQIGKSVSYFHDFLAAANLEKKEYQTEGIRFCLRNEISSSPAAPLARGGIVADEMGLGKTIMMIGLIIANFKPRTLVVLPVALVKQWEQQILKNAGHKALIYYGPDKRKITDEALAKAPVVITTYGHMVRRDISVSTATHPEPHLPHHLTPKNRLYGLAWDRVIFDEAHHLRSKNTQIFRSVSTLKANIRWFVTGTPIQNSIHDFYSLCALLGLEASYYTNKNNIREIVTSFVLKRTKKSVGLTLPPLTVNTITVEWESNSEMLLSRSLHSGIACLMPAPVADDGAAAAAAPTTTTSTTPPALPDINRDTAPRWFPEPSEAKIGRMIQAKQSCIYPRLACRRSVPQMPPIEDANYCSKISKVIETILGRKDNGKRKIVFCHFRGEIDYIQERIIAESPELNVRYLDGRTKESERRIILAPDANVDVIILQIQTCCEGLNLQQFSEVYFVSPDWNPSVEDQAIARCHRFGQKDPVIVYRFIMEPFKLYVDADTDAMRCIDIDTIEAYTANVQNKKRIFADEVLNL